MHSRERNRRNHMRAAQWAGALLAVFCSNSCLALDLTRRLAQLHHTAWTLEDGAPGKIESLAQTADGFLWLGTPTGLYRFDGVSFDASLSPSLRGDNIEALYADRDGGLWIGYKFGGASHLRAGQLTHYGKAEGLPTGSLHAFCRDAEGRLWAGTALGLWRFDNGRWSVPQIIPETLAKTSVSRMLVDRAGGMWVSGGAGVHFRRRGADVFEAASPAPARYLALAPDGGVWASDPRQPLRRFGAQGERQLPRLPSGDATEDNATGALAFDRDGGLWVARPALQRVIWSGADGPRADYRDGSGAGGDALRREQGLSGTFVLSVLEDREGSLWIGTSSGLDRFRANKLEALDLPADANGLSLARSGDGSILVSGIGLPLIRASGRSEHRFGASDLRIFASAGDGGDGAWLGSAGRLWHLRGEQLEAVPLPAEIAPRDQFQAIAIDDDGAPWVSISGRGVLRRRGQAWEAIGDAHGVPAVTAVSLLNGGSGSMWLGYTADRIARWSSTDGGRLYTANDGLTIGNALALQARGTRLWVGGTRGVAWFDGTRFHVLRARSGEAFRGISGLVETAQGELWLNGSSGISRIASSQLALALADPGHMVDYERFDHRDGLDGVAEQLRPVPTAVEAGDGRLWFSTIVGVYSIDPQNIARNPVIPDAVPLSLRFADTTVVARPGLRLPAGTRSLQIDYTAPSLRVPERVRFRYRLQGVDPGWQDAGNRRQAYFTNLQPGRHHFLLQASNDDGIWNQTDAGLDFWIEPAPWQTPWFRALCVALAAGLLWLLYLLRLRQVGARIRERMQARVAERERIARDLHDTLLQGIQGLILRFDAAAKAVGDVPARKQMDDALDRAVHVLEEGRDRVQDLRASAQGGPDLDAELQRLASDNGVHGGAEAVLKISGTPRTVHPIVRDELSMIAGEALANARHHAKARSIDLELYYDSTRLLLRIRDDGHGIDAAVLRDGITGHWGLQGMRERARRIGAELEVISAPQAGTTVELSVPAAVAYIRGRGRLRGPARV